MGQRTAFKNSTNNVSLKSLQLISCFIKRKSLGVIARTKPYPENATRNHQIQSVP